MVREDFSVAEIGEVDGLCAVDAAEEVEDGGNVVDGVEALEDAAEAVVAGALDGFWAETGPNADASTQTRRIRKRKQAPVDATLKSITLEWTK